MKPADNVEIDYKRLVLSGYDACATRYMRAREHGRLDLDSLLSRLAPGSSVLDLGCGSGLPVARALSENHVVTGVDFSGRQLELARENVPSASFIEADVATLELPPDEFDAIVAFYVIFHLPRNEQLDLLRSTWAWLRPGGYLLATLSKWNEEPYTESGFFGVEMYWTNFALGEYLQFLSELGFELIEAPHLTYGFDEDHPPEEHPLVLVQKPPPDA